MVGPTGKDTGVEEAEEEEEQKEEDVEEEEESEDEEGCEAEDSESFVLEAEPMDSQLCTDTRLL